MPLRLASLCLLLLLLWPAMGHAGALAGADIKEGRARLVIEWSEPVEVQRRATAKGFILTFSRPLPALAGTLDRLPGALGRLQILNPTALQLVPAPRVAARVNLLDKRRLLIELLAEDEKASSNVDDDSKGPPRRLVPKATDTSDSRAASKGAAGASDTAAATQERPSSTTEARHLERPTAEKRLSLAAKATDGGVDLDFRGLGGTPPAAAFVRGGELRVLFLGEVADIVADRGALIDGAAEIIRSVRQEPHPSATILRFTLIRPIEAVMRPIEGGWRLRLSEAPLPAKATRLTPSTSGTLAAIGADASVAFVDPIVGDRLDILLFDNGPIVLEPAAYVDFEALSALQGGVLRSNIDRLDVAGTDAGVIVSRPGGLRLSDPSNIEFAVSGHARSPDARRGVVLPPKTTLIGLAAFATPDPGAFIARQQDLLRTIDADASAGRQARWGDLARLHLAHGLADEATGLLGPSADDGLDALRAVAAITAGDTGLAATRLAPFAAVADPELDLWRGVLAAKEDRWREAERLLGPAETLLGTYPATLRAEIGLLRAEAALEAGSIGQAFARLQALKEVPLTPKAGAERALLEARAHVADGDTKRARELWHATAVDAPLAERSAARAALAESLHAAGEADAADAVDILKPEIPSWRGLTGEADLLLRLARLERDAGHYGDALDHLRDAAERAGDPTLSPVAEDELAATLRSALDATAPLAPLDQLLLLRRHRTYLSDDAAGADLVAGLGRRLIAAGFADAGRTLLTDDAAEIFALQEAGGPVRVPGPREIERLPAGELRDAARVAFAAEDWRAVVQAARPLVMALDPAQMLDADDGLLVVQLAIAEARAGNAAAARKLAARFAPALDEPRYRTLLALAADTPDFAGGPQAALGGLETWQAKQRQLDALDMLP